MNKTGAVAGSILCGCGSPNKGLRLQVLQDQAKGNDGPIKGQFVILDAGSNMHSDSLESLLGQTTDSVEVLDIIRENHAGCVHVANSNNLMLEAANQA